MASDFEVSDTEGTYNDGSAFSIGSGRKQSHKRRSNYGSYQPSWPIEEKVDFSYKDSARRVYYDIESLPSLFTITFWDAADSVATLLFFGDLCYDSVTDDELKNAFSSYLDDPNHRKVLGVPDGVKPSVELLRYRADDGESSGTTQTTIERLRLRSEMNRVVECRPLSSDVVRGIDKNTFTEYYGWNSYAYDLPFIAVLGCLPTGDVDTHLLRRISDGIVRFRGGGPIKLQDWLFDKLKGVANGAYSERLKAGGPRTPNYVQEWRHAMWADGHVDIAKMLRSQDGGDEQRFPPGLKKEEAKLGMDIVADDELGDVADDAVRSKDSLLDFVRYNLNDVAATAAKGASQDVRNKLFVRDMVRKMYPYTSARAYARDVPLGARQNMPPERDITEASLTALSLIGAKRIRPEDYDAVSYAFPVPSPDGGSRTVDLLSYMCDIEKFVPEDFKTFFSYWRGKDTREFDDLFRAINGQPLTHAASVNMPYYRVYTDDEKIPDDAFITLSTGGAHGSVMVGMHEMTPEQVHDWTRANRKPRPSDMPTLDLRDVVHADFTSYYPLLMTQMGAFLTKEGVDRYSAIFETRKGIKKALSENPDRMSWGERERDMSDQQLGLKMQLNSATGKANTHHDYALLPLDNKILSMRLIGNMCIWCLGQRMVNEGGYIVSTNTDGIYVTHITIEKASEVIDRFMSDYGIGVEPEIVPRFINRDTSNRLEYIHETHPNDVRGQIRSGNKLVYNDGDNGHNVPHPLAVENACIRYMSEDTNWLLAPYDRERMRSILEDIRADSTPMAWVKIQTSNGKNRLLVDGKRCQKVDRVVLTVDGKSIGREGCRAISTGDCALVSRAVFDGAQTIEEIATYTGLVFSDDIPASYPASSLRFIQKKVGKNRHSETVIRPLGKRTQVGFETREKFDEKWRELDATCIGYQSPSNHKFAELKAWKRGKLSGFPTSPRGVLLDSMADLDAFDMSRLDMDAYLEWAESVLSTWKIGGSFDSEGNLTSEGIDLELAKAGSGQLMGQTIEGLYESVFAADSWEDGSGDDNDM